MYRVSFVTDKTTDEGFCLPGEHIDYSGFSVVPSAIERDVLIAVSTSRSESTSQTLVKLVNYDARYTSVEFTVDLNGNGEDITLSLEHHWSNYVKCGFKVRQVPCSSAS